MSTEISLHTARLGGRRRRFLIVSVAALAVLGAAMGVSFLGDTGTQSLSVSAAAGSGNFVFSVETGGVAGVGSALPANLTGTAALPGGSAVSQTTSPHVSTAVKPSWTAALGAGSVTITGDMAVIDATASGGAATLPDSSHKLLVTVYVSNLDQFGADYSSYALPINVYKSVAGASWADAGASATPNTVFITNLGGQVSFTLNPGFMYAIYMPTGGSWFNVNTTNDGTHNLAPSFFLSAQVIAA
jgi:hypothetical protein